MFLTTPNVSVSVSGGYTSRVTPCQNASSPGTALTSQLLLTLAAHSAHVCCRRLDRDHHRRGARRRTRRRRHRPHPLPPVSESAPPEGATRGRHQSARHVDAVTVSSIGAASSSWIQVKMHWISDDAAPFVWDRDARHDACGAKQVPAPFIVPLLPSKLSVFGLRWVRAVCLSVALETAPVDLRRKPTGDVVQCESGLLSLKNSRSQPCRCKPTWKLRFAHRIYLSVAF